MRGIFMGAVITAVTLRPVIATASHMGQGLYLDSQTGHTGVFIAAPYNDAVYPYAGTYIDRRSEGPSGVLVGTTYMEGNQSYKFFDTGGIYRCVGRVHVIHKGQAIYQGQSTSIWDTKWFIDGAAKGYQCPSVGQAVTIQNMIRDK
jgi:hypothetical protein